MEGIKEDISILTLSLKKPPQYCLNVVGGYLYPSLPFLNFFNNNTQVPVDKKYITSLQQRRI